MAVRDVKIRDQHEETIQNHPMPSWIDSKKCGFYSDFRFLLIMFLKTCKKIYKNWFDFIKIAIWYFFFVPCIFLIRENHCHGTNFQLNPCYQSRVMSFFCKKIEKICRFCTSTPFWLSNFQKYGKKMIQFYKNSYLRIFLSLNSS